MAVSAVPAEKRPVPERGSPVLMRQPIPAAVYGGITAARIGPIIYLARGDEYE